MCISDAHIDAEDLRYPQINALCNIIELIEPQLLTFVGDFADPWADDWPDIISSRTWRRFWDVCKSRQDLGLETVWIAVNHDYNAQANYLPGVLLCRSFEDADYIYRHGWEFDITWGGLGRIPGISGLAFFIADKMPWLMKPIYHHLIAKKGKTPGQTKPLNAEGKRIADWDKVIKTNWQNNHLGQWSKHIGIVHLRARDYARRKKKPVILGHTHYPLEYDGLIANCGDLKKSFTYIYIKDHKVSLIPYINKFPEMINVF